jgi:hypothetical protein
MMLKIAYTFNIEQRPVFVARLALLIIACASCHQENVFSKIKYDKVVAYRYEGDGGVEIIDDQGRLAKEIKKQVVLEKSQVTALTNTLSNSSTYGGDVAACFDPHLGIVFYSGDEPAAFVSICLDCNYLESSVDIPASTSGFSDQGFREIVALQKAFDL